MSTVYLVFAYLSGGVFITIAIWNIIVFHMAYFQKDQLRNHFKNSPSTLAKIESETSSFFLPTCSTSAITLYVTFHKYHVRRGDVSAEDIHNLPVKFRKKCVMLVSMQIGSMAVLMLYGTPLLILKLIEKF